MMINLFSVQQCEMSCPDWWPLRGRISCCVEWCTCCIYWPNPFTFCQIVCCASTLAFRHLFCVFDPFWISFQVLTFPCFWTTRKLELLLILSVSKSWICVQNSFFLVMFLLQGVQPTLLDKPVHNTCVFPADECYVWCPGCRGWTGKEAGLSPEDFWCLQRTWHTVLWLTSQVDSEESTSVFIRWRQTQNNVYFTAFFFSGEIMDFLPLRWFKEMETLELRS